MAQLVERVLGKDEVPGSNPGSSSTNEKHPFGCFFHFVELLPIFFRNAFDSGRASEKLLVAGFRDVRHGASRIFGAKLCLANKKRSAP